jgi:periplasmic protein TonB
MNPNQILSADLLDLVFDDRNKAYGAYELRKSYDLRIKKALGITALVLLLGIGGHLMAGTGKTNEKVIIKTTPIELSEAPKDEPPPQQLPPPVETPPPVRTVPLASPVIAPDEQVETPPATQDDLKDALADIKPQDGVDYTGEVTPPVVIDGGKGVIEQQVNKDEIWGGPVEIETSFNGNWIKFLERNLNGNVPVDNGAPAGKYTVLVQFVIDQEGKVSEIKPLTNLGYGMEQEAIRVLKKADKWKPAIQNGRPVKTYRRQPITFQIDE